MNGRCCLQVGELAIVYAGIGVWHLCVCVCYRLWWNYYCLSFNENAVLHLQDACGLCLMLSRISGILEVIIRRNNLFGTIFKLFDIQTKTRRLNSKKSEHITNICTTSITTLTVQLNVQNTEPVVAYKALNPAAE